MKHLFAIVAALTLSFVSVGTATLDVDGTSATATRDHAIQMVDAANVDGTLNA